MAMGYTFASLPELALSKSLQELNETTRDRGTRIIVSDPVPPSHENLIIPTQIKLLFVDDTFLQILATDTKEEPLFSDEPNEKKERLSLFE